MQRLQAMNETLSELDRRLHQATIEAGDQVMYKMHEMRFRVHTKSTGSRCRTHLYMNKCDSEVVIFVANTDYDKCDYSVQVKSTDPEIAKQLQPLIEKAHRLGEQYSGLLSQHRIIQELSS